MMAKISNILPSTPRITHVDVASERPVRSSSPTFGQPVASTAIARNQLKGFAAADEEFLEPASSIPEDGKGESLDVRA